MNRLLGESDVEAGDFTALQAELNQLRSALSEESLAMGLAIRAELTPAQRTKAATLIEEFRARRAEKRAEWRAKKTKNAKRPEQSMQNGAAWRGRPVLHGIERRYCATRPPSTCIGIPVTNEAASEHNQTTASPTSAGCPKRPTGSMDTASSSNPGDNCAPRSTMGV